MKIGKRINNYVSDAERKLCIRNAEKGKVSFYRRKKISWCETEIQKFKLVSKSPTELTYYMSESRIYQGTKTRLEGVTKIVVPLC